VRYILSGEWTGWRANVRNAGATSLREPLTARDTSASGFKVALIRVGNAYRNRKRQSSSGEKQKRQSTAAAGWRLSNARD
jgi:hypothetical protein